MSDINAALNTAANILSHAPRSRASLIIRLVEKGIDEALAVQAADRLCELKLLDDTAYAAALTESYAARGYGCVHIQNALRQKLIGQNDIDAALHNFTPSEEKMEKYIASRLVGKQIDRKLLKKVTDGLFRRGFDWDTINTAVRKYISALEEEAFG